MLVPFSFYKPPPMTRKHTLKSRNENKTISVKADRMSVVYTDTNKHYVYMLEPHPETKDITLFGKKLNGVEAQDAKKGYLSDRQRQLLDDIVFSKGRYTEQQLKKMPIIRRYYLTEVARKAEQAIYKWKRQLINDRVDSLLLALFPQSKLINHFVNICKENQVGMDARHIDIRTLVSEQELVEFLQLKGLFPKQ